MPQFTNMRGIFNNGQPLIDVEVSGVKGASKKLTALIDSGFNGHLQVPLFEAFPLGLILKGTQENMLADGSTVSHLVCEGSVKVDGTCFTIDIDILPANIVLLGTSLLRDLKKIFILDCAGGKVEIFGEMA